MVGFKTKGFKTKEKLLLFSFFLSHAQVLSWSVRSLFLSRAEVLSSAVVPFVVFWSFAERSKGRGRER